MLTCDQKERVVFPLVCVPKAKKRGFSSRYLVVFGTLVIFENMTDF